MFLLILPPCSCPPPASLLAIFFGMSPKTGQKRRQRRCQVSVARRRRIFPGMPGATSRSHTCSTFTLNTAAPPAPPTGVTALLCNEDGPPVLGPPPVSDAMPSSVFSTVFIRIQPSAGASRGGGDISLMSRLQPHDPVCPNCAGKEWSHTSEKW